MDDLKIIIIVELSEVRKLFSVVVCLVSMEEFMVYFSYIYEEIEKKKLVIYWRFLDKLENRKVICMSLDFDGKKLKKKKFRSSFFLEFFRNFIKYKMLVWRNKKFKGVFYIIV